MVRSAVAFDAKNKRAMFGWVLHRQIDKESSNADLRHDLVTFILQNATDSSFEIIGGLIEPFLWRLQYTGLGKSQVLLQCAQAPGASGAGLDLIRIERAEYLNALFGPGKQHV